jgi:ribose transport system substrate-binding protein
VKATRRLSTAFVVIALVSGCSSAATSAPTQAPAPTAAPATPAPPTPAPPTAAPPTAAPTATPATQAPSTAPTQAPTAAPPSASPEAWTQSDIFKGFDPMALDLTGYTPGPNGEHSTAAADVPDPSPACVQKIKDKKLKLAVLSGAQITWMSAIEKGVREKAAEYGINVAMTAVTDFVPSKEAAAVETVMAGKPDILITIPVDPVAGKANYKPALDAGTTIVFYDNPVDGWTAGKEYVTISTGDHYRMGKDAADLLGKALNGTGTYGFIQLDVVFYNSNNREKGFLAEMAQKYPNIKNVAWTGFTDGATVGAATDAMLAQHPNLDGIYISYSGAAAPVFASLAAANNTHVKVVTHDLDAANDVIMATKDSTYYGTAIEHTYDEGANTVKAAVLKICGETVPPFIVVPALAVNRDNLAQAWKEGFHMDPPAEVTKALGQ